MILLDTIGAEQLTKQVLPATNDSNKLMITLIIFLGVNIIALVAKYIFDRQLKKQDIKISKKIAITELSIKTEAELFLKLEALKNFQKGESHEMLDSILEIENYIDGCRLFVCKKIITIANEYLDYFKKVVSNFHEKDIRKEKEFTRKFTKHYYGE